MGRKERRMKYYITCVQKRVSPYGIYEDEERLRELVVCKDCKWHRENECYAWDDGTVAVVSETPCDGFCYRAERKE